MNSNARRVCGTKFPRASLAEACHTIALRRRASVPAAGGRTYSCPSMAQRQDRVRQRAASDFFSRNEALRREQLREDARRPGGELLEEAMRLSAFATELRAAALRARR